MFPENPLVFHIYTIVFPFLSHMYHVSSAKLGLSTSLWLDAKGAKGLLEIDLCLDQQLTDMGPNLTRLGNSVRSEAPLRLPIFCWEYGYQKSLRNEDHG